MKKPSRIAALNLAFFFLLTAAAPAQDDARVRELVEGLAADGAFEREGAEQSLIQLGPAILPALERMAAAVRDVDAADRLGRVRRLLHEQSQSLVLAQSVSKELSKDSAFLSGIASRDPESVLAALGQITGYAAVHRDGAVTFVSTSQRLSANRSDVCALLREIFRKDTGKDPRWIPVLATALRMTQDYRLHELLGSVEPLLRSPQNPLRELSVHAAAAGAGSLASGERSPWVDRIVAMLGDGSGEVRAAAAGGLLALGSRDQLPALLRHRKDSNEDVRARIVDAIVAWDAADRVQALADFTRDESSRVRRNAVGGIGALRGETVLPRLAHLLNDTDEYVRLEYMNVIKRLEHRGSVDIAARALKDGCTFVRSRAVEILEIFEARQYAEALAVLIDDHEFESIRLHAIRLLGAWRAVEQAPKLIRLFKDPKASIRSAALDSVARLEIREAAPHIAALADDPSPSLRVQAAGILIEWNASPETAERLLASEDDAVSLAVARRLAEAGGRSALKRLVAAASGTNAEARAEALYALNALAAPALYARINKVVLEERRFDAAPLSEILGAVCPAASIDVSFEISIERRFDVRTSGFAGRMSALLELLIRKGEGDFAFVLDEGASRLRVTTIAAALEAWTALARDR